MESEAKERAEKYIANLRYAFSTLKYRDEERSAGLVDLARRYMEDAEYYLHKGDYLTSIACSSYAEGLLDALGRLGMVEVIWPRRHRPPKVLVGGVFDIIHPGHIHLLRTAAELGDVVVVVARDSTVRRLKGREPVVPEVQRLEVVRSLRYVREARLGYSEMDIERVLGEVRPDVVVLGPDQDYLEGEVERASRRLGLNTRIIRLERRAENYPLTSTSDIISRVVDLYLKGSAPSKPVRLNDRLG